MSFVWCFVLIAIFAPLAVARYRRSRQVATQRDGSSSELAGRAARLEVLVGAPRLRERVGRALDDAQLAGRGALEQLLQRRVDHLGRAPQAVHQPEADHRAALAHQRAGADRVRLARRDAVGDEPPERRERVEARVEHAPAGHLEHDVDALAEVGLDQRLGEVLARDVDGGVGAELERQRALLLGRRGRDHAAGAERLAELHGERADAARRGVHDDALARLRSARDVRYRCHAVRPWSSSASAVASLDAVGDARTSSPPARPRTRRSRRCRRARRRAGRPLKPCAVALDHAGDLGARDERQLVAREVGVLARVRVGEVDAGAA